MPNHQRAMAHWPYWKQQGKHSLINHLHAEDIMCGIFFSCFHVCRGQTDTLSFFENAPALNPKRVRLVNTVAGTLYPVTMFGLYQLWYKDYPMESFHFFDDSGEWLQMDKAGTWLPHTTSARFASPHTAGQGWKITKQAGAVPVSVLYTSLPLKCWTAFRLTGDFLLLM
jgi:hypothetical protein